MDPKAALALAILHLRGKSPNMRLIARRNLQDRPLDLDKLLTGKPIPDRDDKL